MVETSIIQTSHQNGKMYLDKVIYDTHWQNDYEKHWRAVGDNRNGSHDTETANNPGVKIPGQLGVNNVDVFRESVNNAADRRDVEKRHWRPESARGWRCGGWWLNAVLPRPA